MNYLFLSPALASIGGMQKLHRMMIRALDTYISQQGGRLVVLALNDPPPMVLHEDLHGLGATEISGYNSNRWSFCWAAIRAFLGMDVVIYGLMGFVPLVFFQSMLAPKSKRALVIHGIEAWQRRAELHDQAIRKITDVISISQYTLMRYQKVYQTPIEQRSFILPCSLDPHRSNLVSSVSLGESAGRQNDLRLLSVARLVASEVGKGVDTVIRAFPELLSSFPGLRFVVIGDGPGRVRLEHLAREMRVDHAVEFRGFVSETELEREYSNCAVYVMPSASEGFGLVFIEAMAYGKPVVAARVGGAPEVVQDRVTGLLIDVGDVTALTQSVKRLLEDADLRDRMGQASLQRVRENYTYDIFCQRVAQILSEISRIQI